MYVNIQKDIKEYKDKVVLNLTWRQLISASLALGICVPLFFFLRNRGVSDDNIGWIIMFISIPLFSIGWFQFHSMNMEKYAYTIIKNVFIYPTVRKFKIDTLEMEEYLDAIQEERGKEIKVSKRRKK